MMKPQGSRSTQALTGPGTRPHVPPPSNLTTDDVRAHREDGLSRAAKPLLPWTAPPLQLGGRELRER